MILVDTSVWVDHFRHGDDQLAAWLTEGRVLLHPFIIGELALGNLHQRKKILDLLQDLPSAITARDAEVLDFIDRHRLSGLGIGYVDAHLLAAAQLSRAQLWTCDKRLQKAAMGLGLAIS
jgi:predicted nucleic acid-binding protein